MRHFERRRLLLLPLLMLAVGLLAGCGMTTGSSAAAEPQRYGLLIEPSEAERVGYGVNWIASIDVPARQRLTAAVVLGDLIVCIERPTNMISAVSVDDGRVRWRQIADRSTAPLFRPTRQGDRLYINSASRLFTLDARTGEVLAANELPHAVDTGHTLVAGLAIFGAVNGRVFAMDVDTAQIRWTKQLSARIGTPPADGGSTVVAVDDSGRYAMYNATGGALRWYGETFGPNSATPVLDDETVYIASQDQAVYALNRGNGREQWAYRHAAPLETTPMLVRSTLFVPVIEENNLLAIDPADGSLRWRFEGMAIPIATRDDDHLLLALPYELNLVRLDNGEVIEQAHTHPLITALPGPDESLILVAADGHMVRLNPRR